jgi:channel protein (hemolysin III family)
MPPDAPIYDVPGFQEPFSAMSHLLGAVVFLGLGCLLLRRGRGNLPRMIFLGVYSATSVFCLSMSGVYHMLAPGTAHLVLARLDHGAIFLFIAGTFTPVHGILFRGWLRWGPLILIWTAAIIGVVLKTVFFDDVEYWMGLAFYLGMGWVAALAGIIIAKRFGFAFIMPLVLGGAAYSIGGLIDFVGWPVLVPGVIGSHEIFHAFVVLAAFWQWQFVWKIARCDPGLPYFDSPVQSRPSVILR